MLSGSQSLQIKRLIFIKTFRISVDESLLILTYMLILVEIYSADNFDVLPVVKVAGVWLHLFLVVMLITLASFCITLVGIFDCEMISKELKC
jgi:hypothetical protein